MLRIGRIPFLNLMPIFYYLQRCCQDRYSFISGVPSEVNDYLRKGIIDISPSSSIEYLRGRHSYRIVPGHSISSFGAVKSIYLFTKKPIEALEGELILYTYKSEASTALLRIVCDRFYGLACIYRESRQPLKDGLESASGYLLIGDEAMVEFKNNRHYHAYDLGELWYEKTGLPFVFALWIANANVDDEAIKDVKADLDSARQWAEGQYRTLARESGLAKTLGEDFIVKYWESLSYGFEEPHMKGLELFDKYLNESGLL